MNYPENFEHIQKHWYTPLSHHWIESFRDEGTGEIIPIERRECLLEMLCYGTAPTYMFN